MSKHRIMAVDDSSMNHKLIGKMLADEYMLTSTMSGVECLEQVGEEAPDLILLDVTMPDMDGYETCRHLRTMDQTRSTPILFLSGRCSVEEKLRGYEVGGDDYITKPFEAEELLIKIKKSLSQKVSTDQLNKKVRKASSVAINALRENSSIGVCLQFIETSFNCNSLPEIVEALFAATETLGLSVSFQTRFKAGDLTYQDDGVFRELEHALLVKVATMGDSVNFGRRVVVNCGNVGLLMKNMPDPSDPTHQVLVECGALLMKGAYARVMALESNLDTAWERDLFAKIISKAHKVLEKSEHNIHNIMSETGAITDSTVQELERMLEELNLDEYQEQAISKLMRSTVEKMHALNTSFIQEDEKFTRMIQELGRVAKG